MHELSLARSIYGIVDRARQGRSVRVVHLQIGQFRQVVPHTLSYCWQLVVDGSALAGSLLEIDHVPVVLDCQQCGARSSIIEVLILTCASCGSGAVTMVTGEEFLVTSIDLEKLGST